MKKILLASVALSAFAGAAAAEVSLTWGGAATVGMAREGGADAGSVSSPLDGATAAEIAALQTAVLSEAQSLVRTLTGDNSLSVSTVAEARAILKAATTIAKNTFRGSTLDAELAAIAELSTVLDDAFGTAAGSTGDFDSYAEANLTATLSVVTEYGITVTGAVSVDAGTGYDLADDDGFDSSKADTSVGLDYITIDGGSFGALTFDKNDIAHLVDADDDETGDLKYTNDFGVASFALVMDIAKDTDATARRSGYEEIVAGTEYFATFDLDSDGTDDVGHLQAVAADVAWSAMISAPIADMGTVYGAFDEEGGNAFGGSFLVAGLTVGLDSKLEALEEELGEDRSNTLSLAYAVDGLSLGASWNSVKDGNQWAVNAGYEANGMAVAFDTNEASEWTATASYDLSEAASVDLGVNYTEDAFVGLSLAF